MHRKWLSIRQTRKYKRYGKIIIIITNINNDTNIIIIIIICQSCFSSKITAFLPTRFLKVLSYSWFGNEFSLSLFWQSPGFYNTKFATKKNFPTAKKVSVPCPLPRPQKGYTLTFHSNYTESMINSIKACCSQTLTSTIPSAWDNLFP